MLLPQPLFLRFLKKCTVCRVGGYRERFSCRRLCFRRRPGRVSAGESIISRSCCVSAGESISFRFGYVFIEVGLSCSSRAASARKAITSRSHSGSSFSNSAAAVFIFQKLLRRLRILQGRLVCPIEFLPFRRMLLRVVLLRHQGICFLDRPRVLCRLDS